MASTSVCGLDTFNTKYNDIPEIPPYLGILFSVKSRATQPLEILTLELDLRLEDHDDSADTSIEVYTYDGIFDRVFSDASKWKQVANTKAVRNPRGAGAGALIPVADFDTITLGPNERVSFYITMKIPLIDFNVDVFMKPGQLAIENDDLSVFVGSGLTEYKFPSEVDTLLDPQFAGVIHYKRTLETCDLREITAVTYQFLVRDPLDASVLDIIATSTNQKINDYLRDSPYLRDHMQAVHELVKMADATAYPVEYYGQCPDFWLECFAVSSVVSFQHLRSLSSGSLLYQMYQYTNAIDNVIKETIGRNNIIYIGYQDVAADFELTLRGVPAGVTMDLVQQKHFSDTSQGFLGDTIYTGAQVLEVQISEQIPLQNRRELQHPRESRYLQDTDGSLRIAGTILGVQLAYYSNEDFTNTLWDTVISHQNDLLTSLSFQALLPGGVAEEGRPLFFSGISSVESTFIAVIPPSPPTPAPTQELTDVGGGDKDNGGKGLSDGDLGYGISSWIIMSVAVTLVGLVGCFILESLRRRRKAKREVEELRKIRRNDDRNIRRQGKRKSNAEAASRSEIYQEVPSTIDADSNGANSAARQMNQIRIGSNSTAKDTHTLQLHERNGVSRSGTSHAAQQSSRSNSNAQRTNGSASPASQKQEDLALRRPPEQSQSSRMDAFRGSRTGPQAARVPPSRPSRSKSFEGLSDDPSDGPPIRRPPRQIRSFDESKSDQHLTPQSGRDKSNARRTNGLASSPSPPPNQQQSLDGQFKVPGAAQNGSLYGSKDVPLTKYMNEQHNPATRRPGSESRSVQPHTPDRHEARSKPARELEDLPLRRAPPQNRSFDRSETPSRMDAFRGSRTGPQASRVPSSRPTRGKSFNGPSTGLPDGPPIRRPPGQSRSFDEPMSDRHLAPQSDRDKPNARPINGPASPPSPPPSQQQSLDRQFKVPGARQSRDMYALRDIPLTPRAIPLTKYMNEQQNPTTPRPGSESRSVQPRTPVRHKARSKPAKELEDLPIEEGTNGCLPRQ